MEEAGPGGAARRRVPSKDWEKTLLGHPATLVAILESATQGILSVGSDGRILLVNTRATEMFGYSREELLGQTIEVLLPDSLRTSHVHRRAEYHARPRVRPMGVGLDLAARRKDGTEFPVEISLTYVEADGRLLVIAFVTDITERKRLEEQLLQSQKMEAVGRLAGGIAHDFNNMLTIISGYNRLLLDEISTMDPLRGYAEEVLKAADRAGALTKQLLAFSRRQIMRPSVLNLNGLITEMEGMLRRLLGEDLQLVLTFQPDLGNVKADPGQIEQVVFNLAINARDAMPHGGRITIETHNVELDTEYAKGHLGVRPGSYVMLAISDTGQGMNAETRKRIFEPFFTTKQRGKGTGLGLSTVYGIVKQSGGDIWVYSELGKGTTFKVYLPRVAQSAAHPEAPREQTGATGGSETILVVEDEPSIAHLTSEMLRKQGYTVLEAHDGLEALQLAGAHTGLIDLLLTDVVMPEINGRDLARELLAGRPHMKVLYASGYTESAVAHHGILDSTAEFLTKPFTSEELRTKIRKILDLR